MRYFAFALIAAVIFLQAGIAEARRVALVIGNGGYIHAPPLANPANDAADMAGMLRSLGFEVVEGVDLSYDNMQQTVRRFVGALEGAELGLFFYAGHGLQVDGENYLVPIDARLSTRDDLSFETMPISIIQSSMERKTRANLLFLDACRDNPLARNIAASLGTRSNAVGRGLAQISAGVGTLIAFSTEPGNVALDGIGRNSPFTTALLRHGRTPQQDISLILRRVRADVISATDGKQVPWESSSLTGDVYLATGGSGAAAVTRPAQPSNPCEDFGRWAAVEAQNTEAGYQDYLAQCSAGPYAATALSRLQALRGAQVAALPNANANQAPSQTRALEQMVTVNKLGDINTVHLATEPKSGGRVELTVTLNKRGPNTYERDCTVPSSGGDECRWTLSLGQYSSDLVIRSDFPNVTIEISDPFRYWEHDFVMQ